MADYWAKRQADAQDNLTKANVEDTEKQLRTYYTDAMHSAIRDFEDTYLHLLERAEDGKTTPADLYKLDKYWATVAQLNVTLKELGDKQAELMAEKFVQEWQDVYESTAATSQSSFKTANLDIAEQMINQVWCADGKSWSERVWGNTEALKAALQEGLIECVVTGKKASDLKKRLQDEFGASYRQADMLVRTEMQHIQTTAAKQRYEDDGITKYEFLGREETHGCSHSPSCHDLDGQVFYMKDMKIGKNAPPIHPNCRCSIVPVVDLGEKVDMEKCPYCEEEAVINKEYGVCDECAEYIMGARWNQGIQKYGQSKASIIQETLADLDLIPKPKETKEYDRNLFSQFKEQMHWFKGYRDENGKNHRAMKVPEIISDLVQRWVGSNWQQREELEKELNKYLVRCQDCGEVFVKKKLKANRQLHCPDCQERRDREKARLRQRKHRSK